MKKQISILLAVAMVMSMLTGISITSSAAAADYTIYLQDGKIYKNNTEGGELSAAENPGITASGDSASGYIYTFTNVNFETTAGIGICIENKCTVRLVGDNYIAADHSASSGTTSGILFYGDVTIEGTGTLTAAAKQNGGYARGICAAKNLTLKSGSISGIADDAAYQSLGIEVYQTFTVDGGNAYGTASVGGHMSYGVKTYAFVMNGGKVLGIGDSATYAPEKVAGIRSDETPTVSDGTLFMGADNNTGKDATAITGWTGMNSTAKWMCIEKLTQTATLVTDASDLTAGDRVIMVAGKKTTAMSEQNGNFRDRVYIELSGSTVSFGESVQVLTLAAGSKSGTYAFGVGEGLYLNLPVSSTYNSNYLRTSSTVDDNSSWTVSVDSAGDATVTNVACTTRNIKYNATTPRFSTYTTAQTAIQLYKLAPSAPEEVTCIVVGVESLCGSNWDSSDQNNEMIRDGDVYAMEYFSVAKGDYQFKIVRNGEDWIGDATGNNVEFKVTSACDVTITYNPATDEINVIGSGVQYPVVNLTVEDVYAVGNGSGNWLNGASWDPAAEQNRMTEISDGVYTVTFAEVPAGSNYQVKFAANGTWADNWGGVFAAFGTETDATYNSQDNIVIALNATSDVTLTLDLTNYDHTTKSGAKFTVTVTEQAPATPSAWDGTVDTSWYNTTDTEFTITTAAQLAGFSAITNGTADGIAADTFSGKTVKLGADIDLNSLEWTPIKFEGTFDGQNHTVKNLKITTYTDDIGFFAYIKNGELKNLVIDGIDIQLDTTEYPDVGALVGQASYSPIRNCGVKNGKISGTVGSKAYIGGLVGYTVADSATKCPVEYCYNYEVVVDTAGNYDGSLVGYNNSDALLSSSYAYVTSQYESPAPLFGRNGYSNRAARLSQTPDEYESSFDRDFSKEQFESGVVTAYLNKYTGGSLSWGQELGKDKAPSIGGMPLVAIQTGSDTYAYANSELTADADGVYIINNAVEWVAFANLVKKNSYSNLDISAKVATDAVIDFSQIPGWENGIPASNAEYLTIGSARYSQYQYTGSFDGNGCTVKGLKFKTDETVSHFALFGYMTGGTVKNITIEEVSFKTNGTSAALIRNIKGTTVENCHVKSGSIVDTYVKYYNVAGLIAQAGGAGNVIKNCSSGVDITAVNDSTGGILGSINESGGVSGVVTITNCHNTGNITSTANNVGGILGQVSNSTAAIEGCYNTGNITSTANNVGGIVGCGLRGTGGKTTTLKNCYNQGNIFGGDTAYSIGGLVGVHCVKMENCYNVGTVTGKTCAQPLVGKSASDVAAINEGELINSYALDGCIVTDFTGWNYYGYNGSTVIQTGRTLKEFTDGAIAYMLQNGTDGEVWGQKLGVDTYPVLNSSDKLVKITFEMVTGEAGEAPMAAYANAGAVILNYPTTSSGGKYEFFSDAAGLNPIDTATKTYSEDTTVYVKGSHTHSWTYTASGAKVTAECKGSGECDYAGTDLTLTLNAPEIKTYGDNKAYWCTFSAGTLAGIEDIFELETDCYNKADMTKPLESMPQTAGQYIATVHITDTVSVCVEYEIAQKEITAAIEGTTTKVYDGKVDAPAGLSLKLSGVVEGEEVTASAASYSYNSKNVLEANLITANTVTLSGADAGNYKLKEPVTVAGTITQKELEFTGEGVTSKVYDGTTKAPEGVLVKFKKISGDDISITATVGNYDTKDTTAQWIIFSGVTVSGADAGNYKLPETVRVAGTITKRQLYWDVTGLSATKKNNQLFEVAVKGELKLCGFVEGEENEVTLNAPGKLMTDGLKDIRATGMHTVSVTAENGLSFTPAEPLNYLLPEGAPQFEAKVTYNSEATPTSTIYFITNGGTAVGSYTGTKGSSVSINQFVTTKPGYTFTGWYMNSGLTYKADLAIVLTENITLYAGWEKSEEAKPEGNPFKDVDEKDWFYEDVMFVYENKIMEGTAADTFSPDLDTTRAMIVTMLWRMEGKPTVTNGTSFKDVAEGQWYTEAVRWAASVGITTGHDDGTFAPDQKVTREQMAAFLYRYAQYKKLDTSFKADALNGFKDADKVSEYASDAMKWAVSHGIIKGRDDGTVDPLGTALRSEVAAMFSRFIKKFEK